MACMLRRGDPPENRGFWMRWVLERGREDLKEDRGLSRRSQVFFFIRGRKND